MSIATSLVSAAEFSRMPDPGHPQELVRGVIVDTRPPKLRHGQVCGNVYYLLRLYVEQHRLGHVISNDTGVITEQDPDTVRGMDVAFIGFAKIPPGPLPKDYLHTPPDAVFVIRSPSDRWKDLHRKVAEYLTLGVPNVYVLDPDRCRVHCFFQDQPEEILGLSDELEGAGPLAGFRVSVAKFFE